MVAAVNTVATQAATSTPATRPPGTFQPGHADQQRIAAIAAALGTGASVTAIAAGLMPLLLGTAITLPALTAALTLAKIAPPAPPAGPAATVAAAAEATYRAAFVLNAAERIAQGDLRGTPAVDTITAERRFLILHREAQQRRAQAAAAVDRVCGGFGDLPLRWKTTIDGRTTPECRAADGALFTASNPPAIGYPGTVHMYCRCEAVLARGGGRSVDSAVGAATALPH